MKKAGLFDQIPSEVWQIDWNVDSQAVPSSEACLKYLAPYVFKVAISNSRILKVQDRTVLIRYRKPHSTRSRILPLEVMEFIPACAEHGRQAALLTTRAAYRLHESPLLRIYESQLWGRSRSHQEPDRIDHRIPNRLTQSGSPTQPAHHLSKLWRSP